MERTYCGKTWEQMNTVLNTMCDIEDRIKLTDDEQDAFDIAIQCITTVMNRMKDNKRITWDDDEKDDDVLMSVMTCKHDFTKLTNGFFDNEINNMVEIEWCTKCGTIRKVRQRDQTIIKQYYPKGLDHFTICD